MAEANSEPGKILVIEDDYDIRESICDSLQDEGYTVVKAENGFVALNYLRSTDVLPTLILLDISMPVMDGYAFHVEQFKDQRINNIPTAMVSADGHVKEKSERAGVVEYFRKPIEMSELLALVERHCRS